MDVLISMWRGMFWGAVLLAHLTLAVLCGTLVFKTLAHTEFFAAVSKFRGVASLQKPEKMKDFASEAQAAAQKLEQLPPMDDAQTILWKVVIWGLLFGMTLGFFFLCWEWLAVASGRLTRYLISLGFAGSCCLGMGIFVQSLLSSMPAKQRPLPAEFNEIWQFAGEPVALITHPFFIFVFLAVPGCLALARKKGLVPGAK